MSSLSPTRRPAPPLIDRERAHELARQEPLADAVLDQLLHTPLPQSSSQAVILAARLGGLGRAFARQYPSWLVTCMDASVAMLSASLDALRPAGLTSQVTVMQSHPPNLPLPAQQAHCILGDLPLSHLPDSAALLSWAESVAQALHPTGRVHLRVARPGMDRSVIDAQLADVPTIWRPHLRAAWSAAFPTSEVLAALTRAGLDAQVRLPRTGTAPSMVLIDAAP